MMDDAKAQAPKRFSEFAREHIPLDGRKIKIEDILDKEILVLAIRVKPSKFGKTAACLTIQLELAGERYVCFTGSAVLGEQAQAYQAELPFVATVKKIDKYYTFT